MSDAQKFIGRNRAPRVHVTYELEQYGAKKMVELPFIVGVMADLAGTSTSEEAKKSVDKRDFLEIDIDNFDNRMKALRPKVTFQAENVLTGEGNIPVSLEFNSIEDFSPDKVAESIDPLRKLLDQRNQLSALLTYMDGRADAEEMLAEVLKDPTLLKVIAETPLPEPKPKPKPADEG